MHMFVKYSDNASPSLFQIVHNVCANGAMSVIDLMQMRLVGWFICQYCRFF